MARRSKEQEPKKKLHNEEVCDMYPSPYITGVDNEIYYTKIVYLYETL
jgi:hypothetical protein